MQTWNFAILLEKRTKTRSFEKLPPLFALLSLVSIHVCTWQNRSFLFELKSFSEKGRKTNKSRLICHTVLSRKVFSIEFPTTLFLSCHFLLNCVSLKVVEHFVLGDI